jgi:hypothetical protein
VDGGMGWDRLWRRNRHAVHCTRLGSVYKTLTLKSNRQGERGVDKMWELVWPAIGVVFAALFIAFAWVTK